MMASSFVAMRSTSAVIFMPISPMVIMPERHLSTKPPAQLTLPLIFRAGPWPAAIQGLTRWKASNQWRLCASMTFAKLSPLLFIYSFGMPPIMVSPPMHLCVLKSAMLNLLKTCLMNVALPRHNVESERLFLIGFY